MKSHAEITETLKQHYEATLAQHGDSEKGHDWGEGTEAARFWAMIQIFDYDNAINDEHGQEYLDYGCGTGRLAEYITKPSIRWSPVYASDASQKMLDIAATRTKLDGEVGMVQYYDGIIHGDILTTPEKFDEYNYILVNGIFTQKLDIDYYEFAQYWEATIKALWKITRRGIAVNFMSNVVDERRENLYHLAQDAVLWFAWKHLGTRNVVFRNDYGLFEYTAYIYK